MKDIRTNEEVVVVSRRVGYCKTKEALALVTSPENRGRCIVYQALYIPVAESHDELLCNYTKTDSWSWVDGAFIQ